MNDDAEARLAEQYRLQGVVRTGLDGMDAELIGGKYNLTDVAACVGRHQLRRMVEFRERRRELAALYFQAFKLAQLDSIDLPVADFAQSNWHMFQVVLREERLTARRADVMQAMADRNIVLGVHYPAMHLFTLYRRLGWTDGDFPHAEYAGRNTLTLPLFPSMQDQDVSRVVEELADVLRAVSK